MTESSANASSVSDTVPGNATGAVLSLAEADLHLWLCRRDKVANSDAFKRSVLSRYASIAPADWQFAANEHGKPHIAGAAPALQFNLSHSGDWFACAVARSAPLGVDLEYCDTRRDVMKLARRFFCAGEVSALDACESAVQRDRFYDLWTLKEAAVKARGEALAPALQRRSFQLSFQPDPPVEPGSIRVDSPALREDAYYCLLDPLPGCRVAICSLTPARLPPALRVYEMTDGEAMVERSVPLRASSLHD